MELPRRSFLALAASLPLMRLMAGLPTPPYYTPSFLHPNDRWVALRSDKDFGIEILDLESGKLIRRIPWDRWETYYGGHEFLFDASGRFLVMFFKGYDDIGIVRWDLDQDGPPLSFSIQMAREGTRAGRDPAEGFDSIDAFPGFLLPPPGGVLRLPDSDWDLESFRLLRRRKAPLPAQPFQTAPVGGVQVACASGIWEVLEEPSTVWAIIRSRVVARLRTRVTRVPMVWRGGEGFGSMAVRVARRRESRSLLVWSGYATVREYDPSSGKVLRCVSGTMPQTGLVAFGADPHTVFAARPLGTAQRWNRNGKPGAEKSEFGGIPKPAMIDQGQRSEADSVTGFTDGVRALAFDREGLALGLNDGRILMGFQKDSHGEPWITLGKHEDVVRAMAFVPGKPWLLTGARDGTLKMWDVDSHSLLAELPKQDARINSISLSSTEIAATAGSGGIQIWDLETRSLVRSLDTNSVWVSDVSLSADGTQVAAAMMDGSVRVWETASGNLRWKQQANAGWCAAVAMHPSGKFLAAGYELGSVILWNVADGHMDARVEVIAKTEWQEGRRPIHALAWSPDGAALAVATGDAIRIYDPKLRSSEGTAWILPLDWADMYT